MVIYFTKKNGVSCLIVYTPHLILILSVELFTFYYPSSHNMVFNLAECGSQASSKIDNRSEFQFCTDFVHVSSNEY